MSSGDVQQADLAELLTALGMGGHARAQSPHEVFQEALGVLRERLSDAAWSEKALRNIVAYCQRESADAAQKGNAVCPRTSAYGAGRRLVAEMVIPMARRGLS